MKNVEKHLFILATDLVKLPSLSYNNREESREVPGMRTAAFLILIILLCPCICCYASSGWDKWNGSVMVKANFGAKTTVDSGKDAINTTCSNFKANGLRLICLTDGSSKHNLRTWLLTKDEATYNTKEFIVIPGFQWTVADDVALTIFGTRGFACKDTVDAPCTTESHIDPQPPLMDTQRYGMYMAGGNYSLYGEDMNQNLTTFIGKWSVPNRELTGQLIYGLDMAYNTKDIDPAWLYRSNNITDFSKITGWMQQKESQYGGDAMFCQFCDPGPPNADVKYFFERYSSSLENLITGCDISRYQNSGGSVSVSVDEQIYRNATAGRWKVAPTFSIDDTSGINEGHTIIWMDEDVLNAYDGSNPISSLKTLMTYLRTDRKMFTRQIYSLVSGDSDNDFSIRLAAVDPMSNLYSKSATPIATMGEEMAAAQKVRIELSIRYRDNNPKGRLFLEDASLVVVYTYSEGMPTAKEVSFSGIRNPIRNYIFDSTNEQVKDRKFYRLFDDLSNIQGIYARMTLKKPSTLTLVNSKDYYPVKKEGGGDSYSIVTAPIWVRH